MAEQVSSIGLSEAVSAGDIPSTGITSSTLLHFNDASNLIVQLQPYLGADVHFVFGDRLFAAKITDPAYALPGGAIEQALIVFSVNDPPFTTVARYDRNGASATWHWPFEGA